MLITRLLIPVLVCLTSLPSFALGRQSEGNEKSKPDISANSVTLVLTSDGNVYSSGEAESSRGDLNENGRNSFARIVGLEKIVSVEVDQRYGADAAALDGSGSVWVWGDGWTESLLSDKKHPSHKPYKHPRLKDIVSISLGESHLVALNKDGAVFTTAFRASGNKTGELGIGKTENYLSSEKEFGTFKLAGFEDAVSIAAGPEVTLVLRKDGTVWGCGSKFMLGENFSLADPTALAKINLTQPAAKQIKGLKAIVQIGVGKNYAVALNKQGHVWGWGLNDSGQLGPEADDLTTIAAIKLVGLTNIKSIAAGYDFLLALDNHGAIFAQGANTHGTLGDEGDELEGELRKIEGLPPIEQIFAGSSNAFAIGESGKFFGWGGNHPATGGFAPDKQPETIGITQFDPTAVTRKRNSN